jgi:hypothetical protein
MKNQIKIPDNFEIDKIENGTIYLKEKDVIPKNWNECVNTYASGELEAISSLSIVTTIKNPIVGTRNYNILPKGLGDPMLALCQLLVCRNAYWKIDDDWKPKPCPDEEVYVIHTTVGEKVVKDYDYISPASDSHILSFRTSEIRDKFYNNFKDLIEQAKVLL